jgi:sec-independent protein translocase protein TatA
MPGWLGPWEIAIVLVVVLLFFGPKRLPEMGRGLGKGMREFRNSVTGRDEQRTPDDAQALPAHDGDAPAAGRDASSDAPASSRERDSLS